MSRPQNLVSPYGPVSVEEATSHIHLAATGALGADWALGWWHGRQHGDEAIFARSFWRAELGVGSRPSAARTEADAFLARWGFASDLDAEVAESSAGDRARILSYTQGFNQGRRRPSKEAAWTPEDCHLLARTLGFLEWWETRAPQIGFVLEAWAQGLGWAQILDLWPGLGPEPDRKAWADVSLRPPVGPEARALWDRVRRFRPGTVRTVAAARSATGRPLLAATFVTDVTEPGNPLVPVRIETPDGTTSGLSRPGHPGFLAGRTEAVAWHAAPALDDTVDLRVVDGTSSRTLAGLWAGSGRTGTLTSLLAVESAASAAQARDRTIDRGSACLDWTAVDVHGASLRWAQGPRWLRPLPRDAWFPVLWGSAVSVGPRPQPAVSEDRLAGRPGAPALEAWLVQNRSDLPEAILPTLRFLLPDTDQGLALKRWTGVEDGPGGALFEQVWDEVVAEFWSGSPKAPSPGSPEVQGLNPAVIRLVQAPHSAWLPSSEKNHRLAQAVQKAFGPHHAPGSSSLARSAPRACWHETASNRTRTFAATVAFVVDPGEAGWRCWVTDDETEVPVFEIW